MNNKRVLQIATKELNKRKAPPAPKDIITDPAGQWKFPGQVTRIPSNQITMQGVNYPVLGVPDKGEPTMMHPGGYYNFPDANYVDEYPQMKKGGGLKSKKYTNNIMGTSYLFAQSDAFKKPKKMSKKRIFDPNAKYYQDGGEPGDKFKKRLMKRYPGMQDVYGAEGENLNIVKDPNYDARSAGYGDIEFTFPGDDPVLNYPNLVEEGGPDYNYPNPSPDKYTALYNPRGANRGDIFLDMMHGMRDDPNYQPLLQNFEKAVRDARGEDMDWYYDQQVKEGSTQSKERYDENYIDSQLRAELAPGSIGMFSKGRRDYRLDRKYDSPEMRAAAKDIRNYLKGQPTEEDYIEADLTPEEIQEYAKGGYVIEELDGYAEGGDPGDVQCPPGYVYNPETKYCEKKSGCPEGYTFDPKSGRCISNYQKESIKIMTAPYKLFNEQNAGDPDNIGLPIKNPEYYEDSELVEATPEQLTVNKSGGLEWPKDFTINEIENPIYIRPSTNYSIKRPDYKEEYEGETEYEIEGFPDLNYKVVVDPKKQEGFNKDESVYYVKSENTHQFKKYKEWEKLKALEKQNLENAKKYGFEIVNTNQKRGTKYDDDYYRKQLSETVNGEKEWSYDEDGNPVYEYSPEWDQKKYYKEDATPIQEWYNDPEYLGDIAYNKSFEEVYKDRGKTNVQKYSGWCPQCTYYHGERYTVDDDYIYGAYNPSNNPIVKGQFVKPVKTLENEYADPSIDQQMPTIEEYPYPEGPGYNPVGYKGIGIHPTWGYDKKSKTHIGKLHPGTRNSGDGRFYKYDTWEDDRHFRGFGQHDRTKLLPFIVQKSTGYNPQQMEGYFNEENEWVPGEYERAQEEGRPINFQGAASLKDLRNQKEYQLKYEQHLKEKADIDKMNKELRQEWLPEPEVASQYAKGGVTCPPGYIKVAGKCVPAGSATAEDSLAVYRNALEQKRYYDSLNKYYREKNIIGYDRLTEAAKDMLSVRNLEQVEKDHLKYNMNFNSDSDKKKLEKVKAQIKNNKQSDVYFFSDLITGLLDPNAPAMRYNAKIKPQGMIEYIPKQYFANLPEKIRDAGFTLMGKDRKFAAAYGEIGTKKALPISEYIKIGKKYGISENNMRKLVTAVGHDNKITANLKGFHTTLPYYDPIAVKPSNLLSDKEVIERFKKYGASGISESRLKKLKLPVSSKKETKPEYKASTKNKKPEHKYPTSYSPVVDNTPKVTPEGKVQVGTEKVMQLDPKTGKVTTVITPVYKDLEPKLPTPVMVNPELQKFVEEQKPEPPGPPPGTGTDVMPVYDTEDLPEYATPDPDAQWVGQTERYIDWDGNSVGYNLPRVRKPGHGGDLIRKGKRRYLHLPSIETRYQAEIIPEEEYAMGGQYNEGDEVELTEAEVKRLRSLGYIIEEA